MANKRESEAKLIVSWMVGSRDAKAANLFISHLKVRLANRVQLTTDGWRAYLDAVFDNFEHHVNLCPTGEALWAGP